MIGIRLRIHAGSRALQLPGLGAARRASTGTSTRTGDDHSGAAEASAAPAQYGTSAATRVDDAAGSARRAAAHGDSGSAGPRFQATAAASAEWWRVDHLTRATEQAH